MLKAREWSTRTQEIIQRIEALLEDISNADPVDESCDNDGEIDDLMVGLDDDSCCEDS